MNAVIYCRTSSKSSRSLDNDRLSRAEKRDVSGKISLQLQEKECRNLAEKLGMNVVGVYSDNGRSCITYPVGFEATAQNDLEWIATVEKMKMQGIEYRDGLGNLMKAISAGGIDYVIIRNETRLMRSIILSNLLTTVFAWMKKYSVVIKTVEGRTIDARNFQDVFLANIISMTEINSMLEKIKNSQDSLKVKRDAGYLINQVSNYGFRHVGKQLVEVVPSEMEEVRKIYHDFLANKSIKSITRDLNDRNIKPLRAKFWRSGNILAMLKAPTFAGHIRNTKGKLIPIIPLQSYKNELISIDDWKLVQAKLEKNKTNRVRNTEVVHPLSSFTFCGECGSRLLINSSGHMGSPTGLAYYYQCVKSKETSVKCKSKVLERSLHHDNVSHFRSVGLVESLQPLLALALVQYDKKSKSGANLSAKIELIENELSKIASIRKNLVAKIEKGLLSDEEVDEMLEEQNKRKKDLEAEKINLEAEVSSLNAYTKKDLLELSFDILENKIDLITFRDLAFQVFEKIIVFQKKVDVIFKNGKKLTLPRMKLKIARVLPFGVASFKKDNEVVVTYFAKSSYKGDKEMRLLYEDVGVKIWLVGK